MILTIPLRPGGHPAEPSPNREPGGLQGTFSIWHVELYHLGCQDGLDRPSLSRLLEIKIINVSGMHYLNENYPYIMDALSRGCSIRFLCANPDSQFLSDIENMEFNTFDDSGSRLRAKDDRIGREVEMLSSEFLKAGMQIRYFSSEYRLPFVIAHYPDGSKRAWLTMTLPPYKSTKSFVLRGRIEEDTVYSSELNFVEMMETNFDTIWNYGSMEAGSYLQRKQASE